jgi:hypothetical protein
MIEVRIIVVKQILKFVMIFNVKKIFHDNINATIIFLRNIVIF